MTEPGRPSRRPPMDLASIMRLAELGDMVVPLTLRAVSDLGVADLLVDGPRPVGELADRAGAEPAALCRALRALAAKGVFTEIEPEVFGLTALAQPLRSDHPLSLRAVYTLLASDVQAWAALPYTLRTGAAAFPHVHGTDYWSYLAEHPDESRRVDEWMASINQLHTRMLLPYYPWNELGWVVDLGGGTGGFLAGLLARFGGMRGTLLDLPHVVSAADAVLAAAGVRDRCEVVGGSFLDPLPAGADAYLLKTVLPAFDDEQAVAVLRQVRAAMREHSRLLLLEAVLPPGDTYDVAKLYDVHTMVLTGGAHRGVEHTGRLLAQAGLDLAQVRFTPTLTILEARPAELPGGPGTGIVRAAVSGG